jgi:hypothetical protein
MRHRFVTAGLWLWRGFEFRGIFTAQTGQPMTPLLRLDNSNSGNSGNIFGNDRPNALRDSRLDNRTPERWFDNRRLRDSSAIHVRQRGPQRHHRSGLREISTRVSRGRFRLTERLHITLDAHAFNLSNTAHFDMPERYADEPSLFGPHPLGRRRRVNSVWIPTGILSRKRYPMDIDPLRIPGVHCVVGIRVPHVAPPLEEVDPVCYPRASAPASMPLVKLAR